MKKLMITIAAVSSVAYMAKADLPTYTSFEGLAPDTAGTSLLGPDDGEPGGATYWAAAENADISQTIVTAYGEGAQYAGEVGRPDLFVTDPKNDNFLKVDTTGRLTRNIDVNGTGDAVAQNLATAPVFFDSLVQFTAAEDAPEVASGDKLVVWLQGTEGENAATNLVITAGDVNGETMERVNFVIDNTAFPIDQNAWYRLTIKAVDSIVTYSTTKAVAGFVVYIDGEPVARTETLGDFTDLGGLTEEAQALNNDKLLFPSLVQPGATGCRTLTSVSFEGTGAIDDLSFSTTTPGFLNVATFALTTSVTDEEYAIVSATYAVDGGAEIAIDATAASATYTVPVGANSLVVTVTLPEGCAVDGFTKGAAIDLGDDTIVYPYTKAFDVSEQTDGSTLAVAITVVEDSGEEAETSFVGGDGKSFTIDTATQATITLPAGKELTSVVEGMTSGMTYAQAYALGLLDEEGEVEKDLAAVIEIVDGNVVITINGTPVDDYLVTLDVYRKDSLEDAWPAKPTKSYALGSAEAEAFETGDKEAGFFKVNVSISDKVLSE